MTELTLFDAPKRPARKRDPETSQIAAAEIEQKLNVLQQEFVSRLSKALLPMTANEVAADIVDRTWSQRASAESFRKRAGELVALGRIEVCGKRKCNVTGKLARVYRVAGGAQ